ncbi:MAG: Qat anti-phage system QueC-like protein QatC [Pyrinomonadaceae bacterium]
MKRQVLVGVYGPKDNHSISATAEETLTTLDLINSQGHLVHGIGNAIGDLSALGVYPTQIAVDLLIIAAHVQAADTRISRSTESQDTWTREIKIVVPVSDACVWSRAITVLERCLNFLTGDVWKVQFRPRPDGHPYPVPKATLPLASSFDSLSLFSGGLDSLIGTIDLIEKGANPLLISHVSEGAVSEAQTKCFDEIKSSYPKRKIERLRMWMGFSGLRISSDIEKTTRARSFLFFSLGILVGSGLGLKNGFTLRVPENGLIALNVPMDPLRLGSHSTRTTHPFYIARWNGILNLLGIKGKIENPYFDKTKGEMVKACANQPLLRKLIPLSLSCSSPSKGRWRGGKAVEHCGYCLPCLIRRAAIRSGLGTNQDMTAYALKDLTGRPLKSDVAEGKQIRSFQYAMERLRRNPQSAKFFIHLPGSLADESLSRQQKLADVYKRGMEEVDDLLNGVSTRAK